MYLEKLGYHIRHRNWRKGHLELDIVATDGHELIVVEVKTRRDTAYIFPQEAVTAQKIRRIVIAADTYVKTFRIDEPVRFDIISIVGREDNFKIEHIKEAFYPPIF
jgi:putative endonuclease